MKVGITGHQRLDRGSGWTVIREDLRQQLRAIPRPLIGLSSLAVGSDQLFAGEILRIGGDLEAVVPFPGYERLLDGRGLVSFRRYIARAKQVVVLEPRATNEESFFEAGKYIVDHVDLLLGIWDGLPAGGLGGTADVIVYARSIGRDTIVIDAASWRIHDDK